jgi:hypothetical protein
MTDLLLVLFLIYLVLFCQMKPTSST